MPSFGRSKMARKFSPTIITTSASLPGPHWAGPSPGPGVGYDVSTDNNDVKSKVLVSCGQHSAEERQIARDVCEMLRGRGFQRRWVVAEPL